MQWNPYFLFTAWPGSIEKQGVIIRYLSLGKPSSPSSKTESEHEKNKRKARKTSIKKASSLTKFSIKAMRFEWATQNKRYTPDKRNSKTMCSVQKTKKFLRVFERWTIFYSFYLGNKDWVILNIIRNKIDSKLDTL